MVRIMKASHTLVTTVVVLRHPILRPMALTFLVRLKMVAEVLTIQMFLVRLVSQTQHNTPIPVL